MRWTMIFGVLVLAAGTVWAASSASLAKGPTSGLLPSADYLDHNAGNCVFTVTDQGSVGFMGSDQLQGSGFAYPSSGPNYLFYGSFLAGTDASYVVDHMYNTVNGSVGPDSQDWLFQTQLDSLVPPHYLTQEFMGTYSDAGHPTPKGLVVTQYSLASATPAYNNFVIVRLTMKNTGSNPINGLIGGLVCDFDIGASAADVGQADTLRRAVYQDDQGGHVGGLKLLYPHQALNTTLYDNTTYVYQNYNDDVRFEFMSNSLRFTEYTLAQDLSSLVSASPVDLAPGDSAFVAFAVIGSSNPTAWYASADTAQALYDRLFPTGVEQNGPTYLPQLFALSPARPSPSTGATTISFSLEKGSPASLKVYDLSGRCVATLVDNPLQAGKHEVRFDGRGLPGGVYFYRLEAGGQSATRKLVMVR